MVTTFAYLKDVRPYKNTWKVQVKIFHSWKQYTSNTGETIEMVISDEYVRFIISSYLHLCIAFELTYTVTILVIRGKKMHATVKKELVSKFVHKFFVKEWIFIEIFVLT